MTFSEITEEEYTTFWENHPLKTFLSSPEIGKLREAEGWNKYFVGLKAKKKIVAAAMLTSHKRKFNTVEFYAPRGFLLDFHDEKILKTFTENVKKFVAKKNGYVLRIDPYVIYKERDIDGEIVEDGEDNEGVVENLLELGFKKVPQDVTEQVTWMFSLPLSGKTEEQIQKEMKPNTRNTIRKAEKFGIEMIELKKEELQEFQDIMIETGQRKGFSIRKLSYFEKMYDLFYDKGQIKYYKTQLNLKKYIEGLEEQIKDRQNKLDSLSDAKYNDGQKKGLNNEITSLKKRITSSKEIIKKEQKDIITLSGSMFIMIQPEIIYLSSGNYEEYMNFNSQYLIQWEMIKYGIKNNFKKHNFYGIPANINERPKDYGIYEFKRGFNGIVEQLIGEFELPINKKYYLFKLIHKLKK